MHVIIKEKMIDQSPSHTVPHKGIGFWKFKLLIKDQRILWMPLVRIPWNPNRTLHS